MLNGWIILLVGRMLACVSRCLHDTYYEDIGHCGVVLTAPYDPCAAPCGWAMTRIRRTLSSRPKETKETENLEFN
jgi:hypothetical protein